MNRQEFFDKAIGGILKQGEYSFDRESDTCMYYQEKDGKILKCAISHLLSDEQAKDVQDRFPNETIEYVINNDGGVGESLGCDTVSDKYFLLYLQDVHDSRAVLGDMSILIENAKAFAEQNELQYNF